MDEELRLLQTSEVRMLEELIGFFKTNGIRYYALAGTMLGAVRHKGFIPWDDDIDIGIPREDYQRTISIVSKEKKIGDMEVRYYEFDRSLLHYPLKIVNPNIRVTDFVGGTEQETNAWITLFPLDGMPSNYLARQLHSFVLLARRHAYHLARYQKIIDWNKVTIRTPKGMYRKLVRLFRIDRMFSEQKTFERMDKSLKKYSFDDSDYILTLMGGYQLKEMFPKEVFGDGKEYEFENLKIIGPIEFDRYLSQIYGDYMTPPPEGDPIRNKHNRTNIEFVAIGATA